MGLIEKTMDRQTAVTRINSGPLICYIHTHLYPNAEAASQLAPSQRVVYSIYVRRVVWVDVTVFKAGPLL